MKPVFNRTLTSMFKPVTITIYLILTIVAIVLIAVSSSYTDFSTIAIEIQKIQVIETFTLLVFIWICGIELMLLIMAIGSGLFATEESEGTMRILLAKPISRKSLVVGKILGLLVGSFIYMVTSLIISVTLYSLLLKLDKDILISLINIIPSYILYGILIIIFFSSITSLFSSLFKKRIPAIILLIVFILLTYGIFPIGRQIMTSLNIYEKYGVYLVDTNSHMGSVYADILESNKDFKISPSGKQVIGIFTGMYVYATSDSDIQNNTYYYMPVKKNSSINGTIVLIIYGLITTGSYILCYNRMKKKDIT
jgi:ABC-type transport system involved in multi-copper enzyme maturation permease subunit